MKCVVRKADTNPAVLGEIKVGTDELNDRFQGL